MEAEWDEPGLTEPELIVHTTLPVDKKTGSQRCLRCNDQLHFVDLKSLPKPGPLGNELSKPEAHCYAPGVNVVMQSPPMVLGEYVEGKKPPVGVFCQKAEPTKLAKGEV